MTRPDNWPELLHEYVMEAASKPFEWGSNDCLFFAANWLERLTGFDPVPDLRGKWKNARTALKYLREHHASYEAAIQDAMDRLAYIEAAPIHLHRGDICLLEGGPDQFGVVLGIVVDARCAFLSENNSERLVFYPRSKIKTGWRII